MKKILVLFATLLFSFCLSAQKIDQSVLNEFTNKPLISTSWSSFGFKVLFDRRSFPNGEFSFSSENGTIYFHCRWWWGIAGIAKDSDLLMKLTDGRVVSLKATHDFYPYGEKNQNLEAVYTGDCSLLGEDGNFVELVQVDTNHGVLLLDWNKKDADKIAKAYRLLQEEIAKY